MFKKITKIKLILSFLTIIFLGFFIFYTYYFYNKNSISFLKKYNCPIGEVPMKWKYDENGNKEIINCYKYEYSICESGNISEKCLINKDTNINECFFHCSRILRIPKQY